MSDQTPIIRRRRLRNVPAAVGIALIALFFLAAIFADVIAPYDHTLQERSQPSAPASTIRFVTADGDVRVWPFVYKQTLVDPLFYRYEDHTAREHPIRLFARGDAYDMFGLFRTDIHLFGVEEKGVYVRLLGSDSLGRDRFSRLLHAIRFSLIAAPLGTLLASLIGVLIGIVSGYATRWLDTALMGVADAMLSLPTLVLILAARAAFPLELPPMSAGLLIVGIFAFIGWAEMARLARGLVRSVREREYILAAKALGLSRPRILFRHVLPNITGPVVAQATIMLPAFLLAEVALSFLGVGLQEPVPSLGNMLAAAADMTQLRTQPVLLLSPAIVIFLFVLGVRLAVRESRR